MTLTSEIVQGHVYNFLKDSDLATFINGSVLPEGERDRDSQLEDAVVIFTTGTTDQIQTGVVTIDIYVPDQRYGDDGVYHKNGVRCKEIQAAAVEWVDSLTAAKSNYKFKLMQTIYTDNDSEIHQHFAVVKLKYEYFDGEG